MVYMIADRSFSYRGIRRAIGERFEVDEGHVELFSKIGHAHVDNDSGGGSLEYATRMMTAKRGRKAKVSQ
jgi:hypothetical protein